jgi:hypothetical protein
MSPVVGIAIGVALGAAIAPPVAWAFTFRRHGCPFDWHLYLGVTAYLCKLRHRGYMLRHFSLWPGGRCWCRERMIDHA